MAGGPVSMTLTSAPHRHGTPKTNRGIPTILEGSFEGGLVDVSAVDTGRRTGSTPWGLGGEAGRVDRRGLRVRPRDLPYDREALHHDEALLDAEAGQEARKGVPTGPRKDSARGSEVRTAGPSLARFHLQPGVPCTRGGGSSFAETMVSGSL